MEELTLFAKLANKARKLNLAGIAKDEAETERYTNQIENISNAMLTRGCEPIIEFTDGKITMVAMRKGTFYVEKKILLEEA